MLRKMFSYGGLLLLAGAAVFVTPGSGLAAGHGGGGHFGGGHFGGGHFGGVRVGGYHGGFYHGGYVGGYRHGYLHTYAYPHYGYRHFHDPYFGYYPYYGYDNYYPYSYDTYPSVWSSPGYDSGYDGSGGDVTPSSPDSYASSTAPAASYETYYPPAPAQPDTRADITVNVPAGARLWFDDTATTTTGPVREFHSPPLTRGNRYTYEVRARWNENGHEVTQTREVELTAGAHVNVNFPLPPRAAGQASLAKER